MIDMSISVRTCAHNEHKLPSTFRHCLQTKSTPKGAYVLHLLVVARIIDENVDLVSLLNFGMISSSLARVSPT